MNTLKLKLKDGVCKELKLNDVPFGEYVTKLELVIEPSKVPRVILELIVDADIEIDDVKIEKSKSIDLL